MSLRIIAVIALSALLASSAPGQVKLVAGDPAPALEVDKWVTGEPLSIAPGFFYIVMFFAPNGADVMANFDALSRLQKSLAYYNFRVVAIADADDDAVRSAISRIRERVAISIGTDKNSKSSNLWVQAAGKKETDLPVSFVVSDDGRVMYIGQLGEGQFGDTFLRILRHRYDPKFEREQKPKIEAARRARKIKNWGLASKLYEEVISVNRRVFADIALEKFDLMVVDMDDPTQAYKYVAKLCEEYAADPQFLGDLARKIATDPNIPDANRRMNVAVEAAEGALNSVNDSTRSEALATLALVQYHNKDIAKAVELQKEAWFRAPTPLKPQYKRVLDSYQTALQRSQAAATGKPATPGAAAPPAAPPTPPPPATPTPPAEPKQP